MTTFAALNGTDWAGTCELWLDALGDEALRSACAMRVEGPVLRYTWSYEGKQHVGSIAIDANGATFTDTFHSSEPMVCRKLADAWGLVSVQGEYGEARDWRWRIGVYHRTGPDGQLVVQMTNVAPWGEEMRAVRMVGERR